MSSNKKTQQVVWLAALAAMGVFIFWGAPALADGGPRADFPEVEPNDAKATANPVYPLMSGDTISGISTASSGVGLDYFRVKTGPLPPTIYRHRLTITTPGTAGHTGTIRGLTQSAGVINPTSDAAYQTSSTSTTPPRFNQWYGFGREEEIYYRVTGTTTTTLPYVATLSTEPVVVTPVPGTFLPGAITITTYGQGHTTDTDLWVYDENFNAIVDYGNDDAFGQSYSQSTLTRDYLPGVYYLGVTNYNFANNLASPPDDDYRGGSVLDFPDAAANSNTTLALGVSFSITDATGVPVAVASTKAGPFDVNWFRFVVIIPETGACCVGDACFDVSEGECIDVLGGVFKGLGYPCTPNPCVGACCFPDGYCELVLPQDCVGIYWGDGTVCEPNPCPQPGACCQGDGDCYMSTITAPGDCVAGDFYWGDNTDCDPNPCPQPGAHCANPLVVSLSAADLPYVELGKTNCGYVDDYDYASTTHCLSYYDSGEDILYQLVVQEAMNVTITLDPKTTTYAGIALGYSCPPMDNCIAAAYGSPASPKVISCLHLEPGTYYIMIDTWSAPDCIPIFDLTIAACDLPIGRCCYEPWPSCVDNYQYECAALGGVWDSARNCADNPCPLPPPNDDCTAATVLAGLPFSDIDVDLSQATDDPVNPTCDSTSCTNANNGVWYQYTPSADCLLSVTVTGEDTITAVWTGPDCETLTQVTCSGLQEMTYQLTGGTTYWILVSKYACPAEPTILTTVVIDCLLPPPNDDCPGAIAVTDGAPAATGNNCAASAVDWIEASCQANSNKDVWYEYTATCTGTVTMSTENSAQSDTVLSVYTGDCTALTEIACDDDGGTIPPNSSLLTYSATFGATYLVRVASFSTGCGGYNLNITCAPSLGACCDDATGICQDDIAEHLCQPPMRFAAGTLCVDLVPPCLPPPCEPDPTGTYCPPVPCPDPNEICLPKKIRHNLPDLVFPPGGIDQLTPTSGYLVILAPGGETMTYTIEGQPNQTTVVRGDPYLVLDHHEVEMTMTNLELHAFGGGGGGGALIHLNPMLPSPGHVVGAPLPGPDYPAESFFDVFVQIDLPDVGAIGLWHSAPIPLHAGGLESIPPWDTSFRTPLGWGGVELLDPLGQYTGYQIIDVVHITPPPPPPPPPWEVIECECMDPEYCHIEPDLAGGAPYCAGGCPPGQECRQFVTVDPFGDEIWECQCVDQPVCEPDPTGTYCPPVPCPDPLEVCLPKKVKHHLPDIFFPPGGEDVILNTFGQLTVLHVPSGGVETYLIMENVPNLTRVLREEAMDFGDHREVAMEMVELNLVGTSRNRDILIRESPTRFSHGRNIGAPAATTDYPADSFFDVFVEIDIPDLGALGLYNDLPIRLDAPDIMRVPPLGSTYRTPTGWPGVELFNPDGTSSEYRLIEVIHGLPPFDPPPEWQIIDCECIDPTSCHIEFAAGGVPYCVGGCPPGEDCLQIVTTDPFGDEIWECLCVPRCPLWGDVNGDGVLDVNDIECFAACLIGTAPPICICPCADMNLDGVLNGLDIQPFVDALLAP